MVRFFAHYFVSQIGHEYLSGGPASSVTITSGASGEKAIDGWTIVSSWLSGLQGMMRELALDPKPIWVNLVSLGAIDTEMWSLLAENDRQEVKDTLTKQTTTGQIGCVEDIAEANFYCMRDHFVTGTTISSNGGRFLV